MVYPIKDNESRWLANYVAGGHRQSRYKMYLILLFAEQLAQIYPNVSDANMGQMRCLWWRDRINAEPKKIVNAPFAHNLPDNISQLVIELQQLLAPDDLSSDFFDGLIAGRMQEFTQVPFATENELYDYAGMIAGNLFALWAVILWRNKEIIQPLPEKDTPFWNLFFQASEIYSVSRIMRSLYWQSLSSQHASGMVGNHAKRRGILFLPQNLLHEAQLDATSPVEALQSPKMKEILANLHEKTLARHQEALQQLKDAPEMLEICKNLSELFAFSRLSTICLKHFAKYHYDYLNPRAIASPFLLPLRLKKRIF